MTRRFNLLGAVLPALFVVLVSTIETRAFSLLGPYASWMTTSNGYRLFNEIGAPMSIDQGYRWNVPTVTYAFDQSFLDRFGSNGVGAVEEALAILNRLPKASDIVVTNFVQDSRAYNLWADDLGLVDLKSVALAAVLEQMGLGSPSDAIEVFGTTNGLVIAYFSTSFTNYEADPTAVVYRNFDPITLAPTTFVNGLLSYTALEWYYDAQGGKFPYLQTVPTDLFAGGFSAVAEFRYWFLEAGTFFRGLTRDDSGGLKFLLRSNTINYEILLPDVHGYLPPKPTPPPVPPIGAPWQPPPPPPQSPISHPFVNGAKRPGVEKITFARHPYNARLGKSSSLSYHYTDTYIKNGIAEHQILERTVKEPDILFGAAPSSLSYYPYTRTGTTNWWNSAAGTDNPKRTGPGIIRPPIHIAFLPSTRQFYSQAMDSRGQAGFGLASFRAASNSIVRFPLNTNQVTINLSLRPPAPGGNRSIAWSARFGIGHQLAAQTSTNLTDWVTLFTLLNEGEAIYWTHYDPAPVQFFRMIDQ